MKKRIAVLGMQPPFTSLEGLPTSRRNTSPPYSALVLAESLRKEAERRNESGVLLAMQRGPRPDRGENGYETLVMDVSDGKVLLHETLPAKKETRGFFDGKIMVERMSVDLETTAQMLKDMGIGTIALSAPWTSGLLDVLTLRELLPDCRMVVGGSGIFTGFAKTLSCHENTFVALGPGFGEKRLDARLYDLLASGTRKGAVVQLVNDGENRAPLAALKRLALAGKTHRGYLGMENSFRAFSNSLFPYLGQNITGKEFANFLSRFELTEGDCSLAEDSPIVHMQLSYGCPHACEYCSSPVLRRGQVQMEQKGVDETLRRMLQMLQTSMKLRMSVWDENPLPSGVIKFMERLAAIAGSAISDRKERSLQIEFTDGFYPMLWERHMRELKHGANVFRENMGSLGVRVILGAYFPAENWGYGDVRFYENKYETYEAMQKGKIGEVLSLFDYVGTTAGMDSKLADENMFRPYLEHLKSGWLMFRQALGDKCALAPFFTQVFPNTALSSSDYQIFGEVITRAMLQDEKYAARIASLYAFGENFASPAFQASSADEFRALLRRFYEIWEEINGVESAMLRKKYGMTVSPAAARLLKRTISA